MSNEMTPRRASTQTSFEQFQIPNNTTRRASSAESGSPRSQTPQAIHPPSTPIRPSYATTAQTPLTSQVSVGTQTPRTPTRGSYRWALGPDPTDDEGKKISVAPSPSKKRALDPYANSDASPSKKRKPSAPSCGSGSKPSNEDHEIPETKPTPLVDFIKPEDLATIQELEPLPEPATPEPEEEPGHLKPTPGLKRKPSLLPINKRVDTKYFHDWKPFMLRAENRVCPYDPEGALSPTLRKEWARCLACGKEWCVKCREWDEMKRDEKCPAKVLEEEQERQRSILPDDEEGAEEDKEGQ